MKNTTVLAIGRWMPIHNGHKQFLLKLAKEYRHLVVGIGSCYENGTPRNCIPAVEREKLLCKIFATAGVTNVTVVPVEDRPTFEEWFADVVALCEKFHVTHFCTGNKEDILNVMQQKNLTLNATLINPEETSDFPYHATDIRNGILAQQWDLVDRMVPLEVKDIVVNQVATEIRRANMGQGQEFVPGRQTVDMVFTLFDKEKNTHFLLMGKRNGEKVDFPHTPAIPGGGILPFESPVKGVLRCLEAETGLAFTLTDNTAEPATVTASFVTAPQQLHFVGIYASHDESINGTRGGGSQCFAMKVEGNVEAYTERLHSTHDLEELSFVPVDSLHGISFAFDQKRMVYHALNRLAIPYDNGELLQEFSPNGTPTARGILRRDAHTNRLLHGGSHTHLYRWENGELYLLLQRRSLNKDSFPGAWDTASAGHVAFGSTFLETAGQELEEELGVTVPCEQLEELFTQRVDVQHQFHGRIFTDYEINRIYALRWEQKDFEFILQPSEVMGVSWVSAKEILNRLEQGDPALCIKPEEARRVIELLQNKKEC